MSIPEALRKGWPLLTDPQKLEVIRDILDCMTPEFKEAVLDGLMVKIPSSAEFDTDKGLNVIVTSKDNVVRVDFEKPLRSFAMPQDHAIRLGILILHHAGGTFEKLEGESDGTTGGSNP